MKDFELKTNTHIVLKKADIEEYLSQPACDSLMALINEINRHRTLEGKKKNSYYVVNLDEPYAQQIFETIVSGEIAKLKETTNG